jgi:hypothetical protein
MVEEIRNFDGLALEELEAQTLDLLPDREEMNFFSFNKVNKQANLALQSANANAWGDGSTAIAANGAIQGNASNQEF